MKNYWTNNELIDTLADALGNRYAAIQYIMKFARHRADECDNVILHSSALVWVVTGSIPKDLKLRLNIKKHRLSKSLDTFLEYVTDDEIKEAVKSSVEQSIQSVHLIYQYNESSSCPKKPSKSTGLTLSANGLKLKLLLVSNKSI